MSQNKLEMQYREKKAKIINPVYFIGLVWVLYALFFPLYTVSHLLIAAAASCAAYLLAGMFLPDRTIIIPLTESGAADARCAEMIEAGNAYTDRLVEYNARIPDAAMTAQINEITDISRQIFGYAAKNPSVAPEIRSFIDYYYPTTMKLLDTYCEMESQKIRSESVSTIIAKISSVMETVVTAFRKQLDRIYSHKSLDIASDIDVFKGVLASEGLTDAASLTKN